MMVSLALFSHLAAVCAPAVHVDTLAAIARTESGFHRGAINDNTTKRRYLPQSSSEAVALATDLVTVRRHSVDLGLMQINSANLEPLGLSPADAMDACKSMQAGAHLLSAAFKPSKPSSDGSDTQAALHEAISRYNTGNPLRGFQNGYVARVLASAEHVVPAIRLQTSTEHEAPRQGAAVGPPKPLPAPAAPPAWDVYGQARYARSIAGCADPGWSPAAQAGTGPPPTAVQLRPEGLRPIALTGVQ